ncbi:hypothetical protein [Bradyrhizobium symbiodeficiens]|uniref:Uncharacterized protein n=1 Tax=Bradyrhizobium symbiodeficiens TaxID=1404367 RepID=A0A6G9AB34_9BRAD|nr:hypothetical protein [Bradyrhizobium symbiodeficiens]QIP09413.1 hypothetical protein HAV00_25575 [Bradyrhizobium symbiodeficiens]
MATPRPNRRHAIRAKRRLADAPTSARAINHENIFVAKNRDSESAKRLCKVISTVTMRTDGSIVRDTRVQKNTCCIEFSAIASLADIDDAGTPRDRANASCSVLASRSPSARALRRQHFFKRDAVFFVVLVYSG